MHMNGVAGKPLESATSIVVVLLLIEPPLPESVVAVVGVSTGGGVSGYNCRSWLAGTVQKTSFVPLERLTADPEFELARIVVRESVSGEASVTVPIPVSHSAAV
jgi:hypothetical protein